MKKVLLVTLALAVGMTGFAQTKNLPVKAEKKAEKAGLAKKAFKGNENLTIMSFAPSQSLPSNPSRDPEWGADVATMMTNYDLQSNGFVADRMHRFEDGTVGLVATWSKLANMTDRGTGYDYYNGSEFLYDETDGTPMPGRIESMKTGWPCYTQYGPNGEIVIAHTGDELVYHYRQNKGEGAWEGPFQIPNPTDLPGPAAGVALTWPKIATTGANHDIIHVLGCDQDSDNLQDSYLYYCRSTDGETWTISMVPTLVDWEYTKYGSDYYALAANGNTVAILLTGDYNAHGYVIKSDDNGETWKQIKFWDNPYAGLDFQTDPNTLFDNNHCMYGPETGSIAIDNNGMVHCAFSAHEYFHEELSEDSNYSFYHGKTVDGIFYWNESMGTAQGPVWTCPDDGYVMESDPHNAFRMWWPTAEPDPDATESYIVRNMEGTNPVLVGFIDPEGFTDMDNDMIFCESVYYQFWQGASVLPAICVDESGAVAIGFSVPDHHRDENANIPGTGDFYYRSIYVSYIEAPYHPGDHFGEYTEELGDVYYLQARLQDTDDFLHSMDEAIFTMSPQNTTNMEFWFGYQADDTPGLFVGNNHNQAQATENMIYAVMLTPNIDGLAVEENVAATNTQMEIYPNPAVNQLNVRLENNAEISVYNIMGQNVLSMQGVKGVNTINVNELTSGVYFISAGTVTQKFIVK